MNTPSDNISKQRKLGRGLNSLIRGVQRIEVGSERPTAVAAQAAEERPVDAPPADRLSPSGAQRAAPTEPARDSLVLVEVGRIRPSPFQPRRHFDEAALRALAESIRSAGVMQPVILRPVQPDNGVMFELVAGERRWRAARIAGLAHVPAVVTDLSDAQAAEWGVIENVQREDLRPLERAWALRSLHEQFKLTHQAIADRVGIERATVSNLIRLTDLEPEIQALIDEGRLSVGHGKALLTCPVPSERGGRFWRVELAKRAAGGAWSVRRLERVASDIATRAAAQPDTPTMEGSEEEQIGRRAAAIAVADLERRIEARLGTKVRLRVHRDGTSGVLSIEFYDLSHFDGLLARMGVDPGA